MKNRLTKLLILLLLVSSCGQNKAKQQQQAINEMTEKYGNDKSKDKSAINATPVSAADINSGLMGEWKCVLVTSDNNTNGVLDPEEKEKGFTTYNDYLKLNADGTCEYTQIKIKGAYEIVEKNGNKSIEIIAADGSRLKQGRIISLKQDELQLMKFSGGRDILIYNRP